MVRLRPIAVAIAQETGNSVEVIEYGLKNLVYNVVILLGVVGLGYLLGVLPAAITAYAAGGSLRMVSGGGHTSTPIRCMILTSVFFGGMGLIATYAGPRLVGLPLVLFSTAVLVWVPYVLIRFAPKDVPNKPIREERKRVLKKWSIGLWSVLVVLIAAALITGFPEELTFAAVLGIGFQGLSVVDKRV